MKKIAIILRKKNVPDSHEHEEVWSPDWAFGIESKSCICKKSQPNTVWINTKKPIGYGCICSERNKPLRRACPKAKWWSRLRVAPRINWRRKPKKKIGARHASTGRWRQSYFPEVDVKTRALIRLVSTNKWKAYKSSLLWMTNGGYRAWLQGERRQARAFSRLFFWAPFTSLPPTASALRMVAS